MVIANDKGTPGNLRGSGALSRTGQINCPCSVGLVQRIGRAKLHPSWFPAAGPSPPRGVREALRREVGLGIEVATHQLAVKLLSGWLRGSPVSREHCSSLRAIAHGRDACEIIASHPEQAGCLTLLGLGLLFCHRLSPARARLLRSGKNVAGGEIECLQLHPSVCVHSTPVCAGEMGGKGRHQKGKLGIGSRTYRPIACRLRVIKGFMHLRPFEIQNKK